MPTPPHITKARGGFVPGMGRKGRHGDRKKHRSTRG